MKFDVLRLLTNTHAGHNKAWGYFKFGAPAPTWHLLPWGEPVFVFYGAIGKSLTFKRHLLGAKLQSLMVQKINNGNYERRPVGRLFEFYPDFEKQVEDKLPMVILSNNQYRAVDQGKHQ
jgi:hypothetical protein